MKDGKISIHKTGCLNINTLKQKAKKVKVSWSVLDEDVFTINVYVKDRLGMVQNILESLSERKIKVFSLNIKPAKKDILLTICLKISDKNKSDQILNFLKKIDGVSSVEDISNQILST